MALSAAAVLTSTALVAGVAPSASAVDSKPYLLRTSAGRCIVGPSSSDGGHVTQSPCDGWGNQKWFTRTVGSYVQIINATTGKCLEIPAWSRNEGAAVDTFTCAAGSLSHLWKLTRFSNGLVELQNAQSGLCLDSRFPDRDWVAPYQWGCNRLLSAPNQSWLGVL